MTDDRTPPFQVANHAVLGGILARLLRSAPAWLDDVGRPVTLQVDGFVVVDASEHAALLALMPEWR